MGKKILFVDDEEKILAALVRECEFWIEENGYQLLTAGSVAEATKLIEKSPEEFYVVVSDLKMPQALGTVLLQDVQMRFPELSTILLTGFSEIEEIKKAVAAGIVSFIQKPWEAVFLRSELNRAIHLAEIKRERRLYLESLERELVWAKQIHSKLLLPPAPEMDGVKWSIAYRPSSKGLWGGGDFFQVMPVGQGSLLFCLGNVDAAGAQGTYHALLVRDMLRDYIRSFQPESIPAPRAILESLNRMLVQNRVELPGCFLNLTAGLIGSGSTQIAMSVAGGELFYLRQNGQLAGHHLPSPGLGYKDDILFKDQLYDFGTGDLLVLASRAVIGSNDARAALEAAIEAQKGQVLQPQSAKAVLNEVLSAYDPDGDVTVLLLSR